MASHCGVPIPKGLRSHGHSVKDAAVTPGERGTPGLCVHYYAAPHGSTVLNCADGARALHFLFKSPVYSSFCFLNSYDHNYMCKCCSFSSDSQLQPPVFAARLQTATSTSEGLQHRVQQHGPDFLIPNILYHWKQSCLLYYQGQTRSSSFRTRAVSAFPAHRLVSLMQSKHVINGPSQPPLIVVRQTLKSNVSTMGGK